MTPRDLVATIAAIAEAIRELKEVPSGTLYAHVCGTLDMSAYKSALGVLTRAKLIEVKSHLIRWVGPTPNPPAFETTRGELTRAKLVEMKSLEPRKGK